MITSEILVSINARPSSRWSQRLNRHERILVKNSPNLLNSLSSNPFVCLKINLVEDSRWRQDVMEMLAISYLQQGQRDNVEKITDKLTGAERDTTEDGLWKCFHALTKVSFRNEKVDKVEHCYQRAMTAADNQFSDRSLLFLLPLVYSLRSLKARK